MLNPIMPAPRATPNGYERARQLRHTLTPAESKLWAYLRGNKLNGISFRRQHAIGPYIVDFCAIKTKIIIELDGSQHLEQEGYDAERTKYLEARGYKVLRFWNNDVLNNMDGVMSAIIHALEDVKT
jgi:very-short-patch-repair endonuclease